MPTSVHIPKPLLEAIDRRAHALQVSRNRLVLKALERELAQPEDWAPGFFERLAAVDPVTSRGVGEMIASVRRARTSKSAPRL